MKDYERIELACRLAKLEGEKRYKYSQTLFNFQWQLILEVAKKGYLETRNDWRHR